MKTFHGKTALMVALALGAFGGGSATYAQGDAPVSLTPGDIKWGTNSSLPAGAKYVVLDGDPAKPGLFTARVFLPPNTKHLPHSHPDHRTLTVLSGTLYLGLGDKLDEGKLKAFPAGSFATEVPRGNHFVVTKSEEAVFQVSGTGPSGTDFVDPADDPRKKK